MDLDKITEDSTECLIANKFNLDVDPSAVSQQWINILAKMSKERKNADWENHRSYWTSVMAKILNLTKH